MYWFISKCLLNKYIWNQCWLNRGPTLWQALSQELGTHCPFGAHSPTHRMTLLLSLRSRHRFYLSLSQMATHDTENGQGHYSSICPFSKYLKNCYHCRYRSGYIYQKKMHQGLASVSSDEGQDHSKGRRPSSSFISAFHPDGGQIPLVKDTIKLCRYTQTQGQIFDITVSPTGDSNDEIKEH